MSAKTTLKTPIYLGAATRTPIGRFGGSLKHLSAGKLASLCLKSAHDKSSELKNVDFVFLGHARQAGAGPNTARQATIFSGLSESIPAVSFNRACASGMTAIFSAVEKISAGRAKSIWAGGVESMSNTPYFLNNARWGQKMGHQEVVDGMYQDGFKCPMAQMLMGETVERYIAQERGISRNDQDQYALRSQRRAIGAWKRGLFDKEVAVIHPEAKLPGLAHDEHVRDDSTLEALSKLPPVFDIEKGSITAGNSSGITDGAAFVHVSGEKNAFSQVEILDYENTALDPKKMGLGPVSAVNNILKRNELKISDLAVIEINEAFAAQVLACQQDLEIPSEMLNPRGGSIALGHPIGASACRITVSLIYQLTENAGSLGIATACVSGGLGVAILLRSL